MKHVSMTRCATALALGALLLMPAMPAAAEADRYQALNRGIVGGHVVPGYEALAVSTEALHGDGTAFCKAPDESSLEALRGSYHRAMDDWMAIQHIRFGPVETLMRGFRIQFWPDKSNALGKQLNRLLAERDRDALEPQRFQRASAALQGLPALERLLFDPGNHGSLLNGSDDAAFRCALIGAISGNLAEIAGALVAEWRDGDKAFAKTLDETGPDNAFFFDQREVSAKFFDAVIFAIQGVTREKLRRPLGKSLERAKPKRAESWRSARSLRNLSRTLEAAAQVYDALSVLLPKDDTSAALDRGIRRSFDETLARLTRLRGPLTEAVVSPERRIEVEALVADLTALQKTLTGPFAHQADLRVGFNSLDGD